MVGLTQWMKKRKGKLDRRTLSLVDRRAARAPVLRVDDGEEFDDFDEHSRILAVLLYEKGRELELHSCVIKIVETISSIPRGMCNMRSIVDLLLYIYLA
jgi:hypothetical protein